MSTATRNESASRSSQDWSRVPLAELIDHIVASHHEFLRQHLPKIRTRLETILGKKDPNEICGFVPELARTFFALEEELYQHLHKEEQILFPQIKRIEAARTAGNPPPPFHCGSIMGPIQQMECEHENGKAALARFRKLTEGYSVADGMCRNRKGLFEDLKTLETDLLEHIRLENDYLHPRAMRLERG